MSAFELNKVVGAVLAALLVFLGIRFIGELIYHGPDGAAGHGDHAPPAFPIAGVSDSHGGEAEAEPVEDTPSLPVLLAAADAAAGEKGAKKCVACHSFDQGGSHKIGPNLWDVVGAAHAARDDYAYSDALAGLGGTWDYASLDAFLASPKDYAAGTKMAFPGIRDAAARADMLAYLQGLSANPVPFPEPSADSVSEAVNAASAAAGEAIAHATEAAEIAVDQAAETAEEMSTAARDAVDQAMDQAEEMATTAETVVGQMTADAQEMMADTADTVVAAIGAAASALTERIAAADLGAGEKAAKKCVACHSLDQGGQNRIGPNLWAIVGAPVAAREGFKYSSALADRGGTWTYDDLDAFLKSPKDFAPGTKMAFTGVRDDGDRAALIAYLRGLSESPAPLP